MADGTERRLRADARRNRDQVLRVAAEVFATDGLAVPVHEIARRAGVGTGTVSRHFPTKEQLYAAILLDRIEALTHQADALAEAGDPGSAFFGFFGALVREGTAHRGLAEALAGAGYDLEAAAAQAGYDIAGKLRDLLIRAQEAGAVRTDVDYPDVKALMTGCMTRGGTTDALEPMLAVVSQGLRPTTG